jgi:two-component system chemotaxis sensor kinase CheA
MQIRHRIQLIVLTAILALCSIGFYAIHQSRKNTDRVRVVTDDIVPSAIASSDLVSDLKDVQLATVNLILANDDKLAGQLKDTLDAQKAKLRTAIELQEHHADSKTQQGLVAQAKESLDDYLAAVDDTAALRLSGQTEIAKVSLAGLVAQYCRELQGIVDTLRVEKRRSEDDAITELKTHLANTVSALLVVTIGALALLSALGAMLYRQIIRPIGNMQSMMTGIAESQDYTRRLPVERADEIGRSTEAFNTMIAKIEEASVLVKQKSADIQAMLQNMPQGILTVTEGGLIHHEYSAYLVRILETDAIAGRELMTTVFADSSLNANDLSQVEATVQSCIGEDLMNFDFNAHLLPGEITKRMADGRMKILDLNWSPITDEHETIVRLMLCVRDITELRKLAAEAVEQKRELEMIGEILAVTQERFHEFIVSALKLVDESDIVLRRHSSFDADAIAELFRNLHTIKGNARTYGLRQLTETVHLAEHSYEELRKPHPDIAWDQDALLGELAGVRKLVERYAHVNEVSLGRRGPGRRGSVERYLMVDKAAIQETLQRLDGVNTANLHELIAVRDVVRRTLRLLGTEPLAEILAPVLDSVPTLAAELGKPQPEVTIEDNGYLIRSQAAGALKNVFVHLIRNALDHGIETSAEREAAGKSTAGRIHIEVQLQGQKLAVSVSDDGRGLPLAKIRARAQDAGLADATSDEATAELIFRAGFSTAQQVSDISGRGVGMDAVRQFLRREGGEIALAFLDDAAGADHRAFSTVLSLPESFAVHIDGGRTEARAAEMKAA